MNSWLIRLAVSGPGDGIEAQFVNITDAYFRIEEKDGRLLDCSWSLEHEPGSNSASIEITVTIAANATYEDALTAIRTAIHEAGCFTPGWSTGSRPDPSFTAELQLLALTGE